MNKKLYYCDYWQKSWDMYVPAGKYNPVSEYVYGNNLVSRSDYDEKYAWSGRFTGTEYYTTDILGSVMLTTDSLGRVSNRYNYDAYGTNYTGSFSGKNKIGYNSKHYDTGTGWYNYGYRDYDSKLGRFTTQDPIRDGMNWYAYCGGDPINYVDLWGLELTLTLNKKNLTLEVVYKVDGKIQDVMYIKGNNDNLSQSKITTAVKSWDNSVDVDTSRTTSYGNNPKRMPDGEWKITGIKKNPTNNKSYGKTWITTDAHQEEPYPDGTSKDGGGYQIHLTSTTNTDGCLGIHDEQLMNQLVDFYCRNEEREPGTAKLIVKNK